MDNIFQSMMRRLSSLNIRGNNRSQYGYSFELMKSSSSNNLRSSPSRTRLPRFYSSYETNLLASQNTTSPHTSKNTSTHTTPQSNDGLSEDNSSQANSSQANLSESTNSEEVVEIIGRDKLSSNDCTILLGFLEKESLNSESDDMFSSFKQFGLVDNENKRIEALDKAIAQCNNVRNLPRFKEGILLKCLDKNPTFPYLNYSIFKGDSYAERTMTINNYIHSVSNYSKSQYGPYEEVFTINKMGSIGSFNLPTNRHAHAGFIINSFKIIDSNRTESLEGSWLIWSGASVIYKSSPRNWNLRKISLVRCTGRSGFKKDNFDYVLLCEFGNIFHPNNTIKALDMCERLKTRNCGHISLYQIKYAFESEQIQGMGSMTNYNSPIHARPSPTSLQTSKRNPLLRGVSQDVGSTTLSRSPRHYAHKLTSMGSVDQSSSRYDPFYESETMDF